MGFLDLMPPDMFLKNLEISALIFNRNEIRLSELYSKLKIERIRLKNKIKEMVKLKLITVKKIVAENDIKITATVNLGVFFEAFFEEVNTKKSYERKVNNTDKRKKHRRKKLDNVILKATPKLVEFVETTYSIVRSTETQLKKKGYI